jgi:uncharacterized membrane protein YsdA (DUF1294 family)
MHVPARRKRPVLYHFLTGLVIALILTALLWFLISRRFDWRHLLVCWLFAMNATAFGYYAYDKSRARSASSRVPEIVLHGWTALGGSVGSYAAMQLFRHKTLKGQFRIMFWLIVALQVALLAWLIKLSWWG